MAHGIEENVHVVQRVAEGDMTAFVNIRSSKDSLSKNLYKMVQTNDLMFNEITEIANQVASGAEGIADASGSLANSCTQQIHSITDFKEAVSETVDLINENVETIEKSKELSGEIKDEVAISNEKMEQLLKAMEDISVSSDKICPLCGGTTCFCVGSEKNNYRKFDCEVFNRSFAIGSTVFDCADDKEKRRRMHSSNEQC